MKKKLLAMLTVIFALALTLAFGISALAADDGGTEGTSVASDNVELIPKIVSKNVSYASSLHIYYAVPVSTVREGATVSMEFYKSTPDGNSPTYTVTEYEKQKISAITGVSEDYYVFRSYGFAAKNIGDEIYAVPVATVGDNVIRGEAVKYSIAEYCYERLYKAAFITKTKSDGMDYFRRELYLNVLEYGAAAQQLFYIDKGQSVDLVNDNTYYALNSVVNGAPYGFGNAGDTIAVTYDGTVKVGRKFDGWILTTYVNGVKSVEVIKKSSFILELVAGGCVVEPSYIITDPIAVQEEEDVKLLASKWANLETYVVNEYGEEVGLDLIAALRDLYSMYTDDIVDWSASLYAKGFNDLEGGNWAGGYYASTGGRDTAGLGPDVQCTEQMLRFISTSGMADHAGGVAKVIPDWMLYEMTYFALSLQDSNGYFYHPQWGKEATDAHLSRRGRDLGWACDLLVRGRVVPKYATPNGKFTKDNVAASGVSADEYLHMLIEAGLVDKSVAPSSYFTYVDSLNVGESAYLTESISGSAVYAVSKVISVETDSSTAHLESYEGFLNYLVYEVLPEMQIDPYTMGNEFASQVSQFTIANDNLLNTYGVYTWSSDDDASFKEYDGLTLKEMTIKGLNSVINPKTGLWGELTDKYPTGTEFLYTNGFMKTSSVYNEWHVAYPYPVEAAKALMYGLTSEQPSTGNICEVYNVWTSVDRLQSNLKYISDTETVTDEEGNTVLLKDYVKDLINGIFKTNVADAVRTSYEKVSGYKKVDGGFSHSYSAGTPSHQGLKVSNGANVSDVDATCIGTTGLTREIYNVLGIPQSYRIPLYTQSDWMRYEKILEEAEPIRKGDPAEAKYTFSDAAIPEDVSVYSGTVTVVKNNNSNALMLEEKLGAAMIVNRHSVSNRGDAVLFECDLDFARAGDYTLAFNTANGVAVKIIIRVSDSTVTLIDAISGTSLSEAVALGDKFTLRLETSPVYEESEKTYYTVTRAEINSLSLGTLVSYAKAEGYSPIDEACDIKTLSLTETTAGSIVVDNLTFVVTAATGSKDFEDDFKMTDSGIVRVDGINYTFTRGNTGEAALKTSVDGSNKYLTLDKIYGTPDLGGCQSYIHCIGEQVLGNTVTFETRMRVNFTKNNGGALLKLNIRNARETIVWQMELDSINRKVKLYENGKTSSGSVTMSSFGITDGDWFTLKVEITTDSLGNFEAVTSVNGTERLTTTTPVGGFADANTIVDFGVVPTMGWIGTVDLDDMSFTGDGETAGTEENATIPTPAPSITNDDSCIQHIETTRTENTVDPSCEVPGSYDKVTYCIICGEEISRETVEIYATGHTAAEAVKENVVPSTCTAKGSYDSVVKCSVCGDEISRTTYVTSEYGHTAGAVTKENVTNATCTAAGSYDNVVRCTECDEIISKETVTEPKKPHTEAVRTENNVNETCVTDGSYEVVTFCSVCEAVISRNAVSVPAKGHDIGLKAEGICSGCGEEIRLVGAYDFSAAEAGEWTVDGSADVFVNQLILASGYSATFTNTIVTDEDGKYLKMDRSESPSSKGQTMMLFERNTANEVVGDLVFEARIRANYASGTSSYLRFYNGRKADGSASGTQFGDSSTRNISFKLESGVMKFNEQSIGVGENEWFTLRLVLSGTTVTGYVVNEDGTATHISTVEKSSWADLSDCTTIAFIADSGVCHSLDVAYVYFGGEKKYVNPKAQLPIPDGAFTFDDLESNEWTNGMGNSDVTIGTSKQASAIFVPSIVTDGDNKYFSVTKSGVNSGSAMAWVMIRTDAQLDAGSTKVFQTRMAFNNNKTTNSTVNIRIYNGRTIASGGGTELTSRITMAINSQGYVTIGGESTEVKAGEWFNLRVVMNSTGATFYAVSENGTAKELCNVTGDTTSATTIQFTSQAADMATYEFDYIYFAGEIAE